MAKSRFKMRKIRDRSHPKGKIDIKRLIKRGFLVVFCLFIAVILGSACVFAYFAKDLPSPDRINTREVVESTKIYDRTGKIVLYEVHGEIKRTIIPLEEISDYVKEATIACEDKDFYSHRGFDIRGIVRAILANLGVIERGDTIHGGSTITQQFVKNSILTSEKTFTRKIKELILSIEMERRFSKEEILKMYLNEIPYGSNAYGIEAASQTFFEKSASDLTLAEAALLASLPKAPTHYSPYGSHPEELKARQKWVLDRMVECGFIDSDETKEAEKEELNFTELKTGIIAPHFVMYVKERLVERYGEKMVEQGGLKVHTTLDMDLQKIAEKVVPEGVAKNEKKYNAKNAALAALDPKTGQILAMQGSRWYFDIEHEGNVNVTIRERQPGSSFKPFAYAQAFSKGYTPETLLYDLRTDFGGGYRPNNYDGRAHGPVSMRTALACSFNIPSVKTLYLAGIDETIDLAHKMGITTLNERERYGLSLVLGGGEVKLLDMVSAFGVFAQEGIRKPSTCILKIEDKNGKILEEWKNSKGEQVLEQNVARTINDVLSDNVARSPVFGSRSSLTLGSRPVACKTGTTQEYRDAWTIGYTPSLVAGVWAGNNDNSPMYRGAGVYAAAPIWQAFMLKALEGKEIEQFEKPSPIRGNKLVLLGKQGEEKAKICKSSGKLASDLCPEHLVEEKIFKEPHCILYYLNKDDPLGDYPRRPQDDPQYIRWEGPVKGWAESQEFVQEKPPQETCDLHTEANQPKVAIISPKKGEKITDCLKVSTKVSAPLGVARVEFWLDDSLIYTDTTSPYEIQFIPRTKSSSSIVLVRAYDKMDNMGEAKVTVKLDIEKPKGTIALTSPKSGLTLSKEDFPYTVLATLSKDIQAQKVQFYSQKISSPKEPPQLIDQVVVSSKSKTDVKVSVPWPYLGPGAYQVYAQAFDKKGNMYFSEKSEVKVEELAQ